MTPQEHKQPLAGSARRTRFEGLTDTQKDSNLQPDNTLTGAVELDLCRNLRKAAKGADFVNESTAAWAIQMSVQWMRKNRQLGTGPIWVKFGESIKYPVAGLEAYIFSSVQSFMGQASNRDSNPGVSSEN